MPLSPTQEPHVTHSSLIRCTANVFGLGLRDKLEAGLVAVLPLLGCQCADPALSQEGALDSADVSSSSGSGSSEAGEAETEGTEGSVDASPFVDVYHNEFVFVPFGVEVPNPGDPTLANLEIRPDGTASMTMENCDPSFGPIEIAWRWEARPGPTLEFTPGPGEESLRFMARSELQSVRATLDGCDLVFEVDGVQVSTEVYRPGRACWVNRCEPAWTVHIDYCEGEEPPSCE